MEFVATVSTRHEFRNQFEVKGGGQTRVDLSSKSGLGSQAASRFPGKGGGGSKASSTPRVMKDEISRGPSGVGSSTSGSWQESSGEEQQAAPPETSQLDPRAPVRKGKWTPEEEMYTTRIINDFNKGLLPLAPGTTLRSYLSEKLNCDPMRITKKFAGASCIGKRVFMPVERTPENLIETHRSQRDLEEMARKFQNRLENMRPGGSGRSSSANSKSSSVQSSPKTRRSTAQAAGASGANPGGNGSTAVSSGNVSGARHAADTASCRASSALGGGAGEGVEGRRTVSRSPSPGAHGPHSACDDSAPHPEGSPSHRASWDREDGEGYGHYEPMDQSPSVDSETSSSSSSRAQGYSSGRSVSGSATSGIGGYGAAGAPNAVGYGAGGSSAGGHSMGFGGKCQYEDCVKGESRLGAGAHAGAAAGESQSSFLGGGHGNPHQRQTQQGQQQHSQGSDAFGRHGGGQRRSYMFSLSGSSSGDADENDGVDGETPGDTGAATGSGAGLSSSMIASGGRGSPWLGRSGPSGGLGPKPSSEPRTLPPGALSTANAGREGAPGGGSGSRSPTWPLPRSIPEGSEISDHDAGGLLLGFFRSVHEKVQTAANELEEESSPSQEESPTSPTGNMHPLLASKRGCRSISSPALTQFAHYAEQLPRLQIPTFKRRKSVASFV